MQRIVSTQSKQQNTPNLALGTGKKGIKYYTPNDTPEKKTTMKCNPFSFHPHDATWRKIKSGSENPLAVAAKHIFRLDEICIRRPKIPQTDVSFLNIEVYYFLHRSLLIFRIEI